MEILKIFPDYSKKKTTTLNTDTQKVILSNNKSKNINTYNKMITGSF